MKRCSKGHSLSDKNRADRIPYGNAGLFDDPWLEPFVEIIQSRLSKARKTSQQFTQGRSWQSAADYHNRFGLHRSGKTWVFREWAPNATGIFILCPANQWKPSDDWALTRTGEAGIFEGRFPEHCFAHKGLYRLWMVWDGGESDRIPTAATRVVQDPGTLIFNAQVWAPNKAYHWQTDHFIPPKAPLLVYEAHPGMALEEGRIGTWVEFAEHLLPKIVHAGYNTLLLMAVQEHPYYGSFGYHVSSFFAPSSRFGTPDDLKYLIDMAHGMDIRVLVDIVHSHSVKNEVEGLSRFDGTDFQFFHGKDRGHHKLWDSRCFDYGKPQVLNFLLSNLRFFMEEFRVDGFRFDGVTSMLFHDHGLGRDFTRYADYFGDDVDQDALNYLFMANDLVHSISSRAITIAEDVSGYPGLAAPKAVGGTGFDLRFAMGIADMWIRLLKEVRDEDWHLGTIWFELIRHRTEEKTISYVECHDQALVGDQTLMMRLMGERIYTGMQISDTSAETLRAVALHKMIRLVTLGTAHKGYLTFMGNEFGHPEWVDFPSPGNGYSYTYARRQWSLKYDPTLYYCGLFEFDRQMIA
ncbi:MAG TPA: 1,4-alpha-glucan-branching enzyme, partial [Desulfobacteraceae bacterium]|nr:1,4-alpha-glucan-branching enzyme [Desulfobacteraceae bacterium]